MSNTISFVQGTSRTFQVALVDGNGEPLSARPPCSCSDPGHDHSQKNTLVGATATFTLRVHPTDSSNVLFFSSVANPTSLSIDPLSSSLTLTFVPIDTSSLTLGLYFYQVQVTLVTGDVYDVIPWNLFDLNLGGAAATPPPIPSLVSINQDYPTPGALLYQTPGGCGIEGAYVRLYLKSDIDAGNFASPVGITTTTRGGGWATPIMVPPGFTYLVQFQKPFEFGPDLSTPFFA